MKLSKGFIFTFSAAFAWALSIVIQKVILKDGENTYNLLFWTSLLALPFWIFKFGQKRDEIKKLTRTDYEILLGMGLVSAIGVSIVEILAIKYSPAINYAFLIRTVILFTFVFAYIFLGEKFTKKKIILALFLLTGAYLLTTEGKLISLTKGDILTLLEAALIAFGNNVLGKMATNRMSSTLSASSSILIGFIPKIVIAVSLTSIALPTSLPLLIILTLVGIVGTQLRFSAYKNATASYITMVYTFTPVFVSFMAIPILGESMSLFQIIGGVLIIMAGIMVEKLKV